MTSAPDECSGDEQGFAEAQALAVLLQHVGYALWQAAECEDTLAHVVVLRLRASQGIGRPAGEALLEKATKRTFGHLLQELREKGVLEAEIERRLQALLEERNWLVHRAKRESRGVLNNQSRLHGLMTRIAAIADEASELQRLLASQLEAFVVGSGVDPAVIDREAEDLVRAWGY